MASVKKGDPTNSQSGGLDTWLWIVMLAVVNMAAATFMINESAGYYQMLYDVYKPNESLLIPWAAAILTEVFQHILLILKGPTERHNKNYKRLAVFLFGLTVFAAGYKVYKPIEIQGKVTKTATKLQSIILQEIEDNRQDQHIFTQKGNIQKGNAAKAANERRENYDELKKTIKESPTDKVNDLTWPEIIQLFLLRIGIQISALICTWNIGHLYRSRRRSADPQQAQKSRKVVKRWKAKYIRAHEGWVGVVQLDDETFLSVMGDKRKPYKTWNGAVDFFIGTKFEGKIPEQPTSKGDKQ